MDVQPSRDTRPGRESGTTEPIGARMNRLLLAMMLLQEAPAIDYARDRVSQGRGGHGKHGATSTAPSFGQERPLVVLWTERLEAVLRVMERDLYRVRQSGHGRAAPQDKRSSTRQAERAAILREAGHDPVFLGFLYGWAPDSIRKLRRQRGLDPETGERTPRALTAPASLQLRDHDDRGADS